MVVQLHQRTGHQLPLLSLVETVEMTVVTLPRRLHNKLKLLLLLPKLQQLHLHRPQRLKHLQRHFQSLHQPSLHLSHQYKLLTLHLTTLHHRRRCQVLHLLHRLQQTQAADHPLSVAVLLSSLLSSVVYSSWLSCPSKFTENGDLLHRAGLKKSYNQSTLLQDIINRILFFSGSSTSHKQERIFGSRRLSILSLP